ncbi:2-hydroxyacid dehydrogenase [Segnochrobactraceae bacterium EtOH-i3]
MSAPAPLSEIDILVQLPLFPGVISGLQQRFRVHAVRDAAERAAVLASHGDRIRGVATMGTKFSADLMDSLPALEIVSSYGVGYDAIDAVHAASRGLVVTNTPDVLTDEVADVGLGLLIMTARELGAAERYLRAGRWGREGAYPLTPGTLRGRSLGILGLGRIGLAVAKRAEAFGLTISYCNRHRRDDVPYAWYPDVRALAEAVDTLMVVVPGGAETRHLINAEVLRALGPTGILINIGRGSAVDTDALAAALKDGTILAAGLDVLEGEPAVPEALLPLERLVLLPHVASASQRTRQDMADLVVANMVAWFEGRAPLTPVAETPVPPDRG